MSRHTIMQFIPNLLSGGAERFVVDLANEQSKLNNVLLVIFYSPETIPNQIFLAEVSSNVKVIFLDKKLGFDFGFFYKIYNILKKYRPEVIHTHIGAFRYVYPVLFFFSKKIKAVHTIHNVAEREAGGRLDLILRKLAYRRKLCFPVTISPETSLSFQKVYPGIEYRLIENGRPQSTPSKLFESVRQEINNYKLNSATKVLIFIGRLSSYQKNIILLFNSFLRIRKLNYNAILLVIGRVNDSPDKEIVSGFLKSIRNKNTSIFYLGEKLNATDYLQFADFICLSSRYEGMPITLIEAFAAGVVPVVTPVGGMPGMVKENGFISGGLEEDDYFNALKQALEMKETAIHNMQKSLKKQYDLHYNIINCAQKYQVLYNDILKT